MKEKLHRICRASLAALSIGAWSNPAFAHAADRGFVMLLPTGYYIVGGAFAVAASFLILALVPPAPLDRLARGGLPFLHPPFDGRALTSVVSFAIVCALLFAGIAGSRDPLSNPLPLVFWTVWWVGLTLAIGVFGNLWRWLEPWYGLYKLATVLSRRKARFALPVRLGYLPAIVLFLAFAWFELVYPTPDDPYRLAVVLAAYWLFNFVGMLLFGHETWTARVECFSVFFSMVARLSPFERSGSSPAKQGVSSRFAEGKYIVPVARWKASGRRDGAEHRGPGRVGTTRSVVERAVQAQTPPDPRPGIIFLRLPGAKAVGAGPLPVSGVLFLLLALSTVSYDGLMRTFFWLGLIGVNPLEFPGRSAVLVENTLGLFAAFALLAGLFFACVRLGQGLVGKSGGTRHAAGALVWSILPISLAYHFSHYLVSLVINGQYALAAISDPLSRGWNLFGTAGYHVVAGATAGADSAWLVWNLQAGAIIGGHMLAVAMAHVIAYRLHGDPGRAAFSQLPLALLMVGYTVLGLWLLSSPTGY
jgi:hypothetical protein